ncbi:MAG: hypothetical protein LAO31_23075 [Acidobacteriia bacterium]|nr:hypothetical protein [Terriglobia bacterium]
MADKREVLIVAGIAVEGLNERSGRKHLFSKVEDPINLRDGPLRKFQVLKNGLAINGVHHAITVRKSVGISDHIDIREGSNIQIDEVRMHAQRTSADGKT